LRLNFLAPRFRARPAAADGLTASDPARRPDSQPEAFRVVVLAAVSFGV